MLAYPSHSLINTVLHVHNYILLQPTTLHWNVPSLTNAARQLYDSMCVILCHLVFICPAMYIEGYGYIAFTKILVKFTSTIPFIIVSSIQY